MSADSRKSYRTRTLLEELEIELDIARAPKADREAIFGKRLANLEHGTPQLAGALMDEVAWWREWNRGHVNDEVVLPVKKQLPDAAE